MNESGCGVIVARVHGPAPKFSGCSIVAVRKAGGLVAGVRFSPPRLDSRRVAGGPACAGRESPDFFPDEIGIKKSKILNIKQNRRF